MSEPRCTEAPTLEYTDGKLVAHNGGWLAESGEVTRYLFRFVKDGRVLWGLPGDAPKSSSQPGSLPGEYPSNSRANIVTYPWPGSWYAEVSGGVEGSYPEPTGRVVEWGRWARSNTVTVPATTEPPKPAVQPNVPAAIVYLEKWALPNLLVSNGYKAAKAANPRPSAFARTHIATCEQMIRDALAALKGGG